MGHQRKLGSYSKNRNFWPKTEILGPKKGSHFFPLTMFWPRPEKVVQRKKLPLLKGLPAESARAVTGRRCPHSGRGEDFLSRQPDFFYGNCCNFGTESRKIAPKVGN